MQIPEVGKIYLLFEQKEPKISKICCGLLNAMLDKKTSYILEKFCEPKALTCMMELFENDTQSNSFYDYPVTLLLNLSQRIDNYEFF